MDEKFTLMDLADFVIADYADNTTAMSVSDGLEFIRAFAESRGLEFDTEAALARWAETYGY